MSKPTKRQIEAAISTLGNITYQDHPLLDGRTRDEFGHVIHVLDQFLEDGF